MRRLLVLVALFFSFPAQAVVTIDWVPVGNANNTADTPSSNCFATNCGSVDHAYYISKYEVTNAQYAEFLNAKAASDPLGLYSTSMGSDATFGGITQSGSSGSYTYTAKVGFENKPVTYVSFYDSLRFSNWLNNGQVSTSTETGAYTLLGGTAVPSNGTTVARNGGANIFLTSENEWYKAAYYSAGGVYFDYPTGTNTQSGCVAPGSDTGNSANCSGAGSVLTNVGAYGLSGNPYGTYDQGGNLWEWNEQIVSGTSRGTRGGDWFAGAGDLAASVRNSADPSLENSGLGFRVARPVPEPIDWVPIGNANNTADTPSSNCLNSPANCGSVDHAYFISKYETTNAQYAEFLNAADAGGSNALALYSSNMNADATNGGISFVSGNAAGSKYVVKAGFANKPVTYVSFYDSLRFSNWLNNGQGGASTETGAYTLLGGTAIPSNAATVTRNGGANIFLTSENEWYKAAYYSASGVYFDYPAGTNTATVCAAPTATANSANCFSAVGAVTNAGAYTGSASPYGTYDQGGNVWEWNEESFLSGSYRGVRGGGWGDGASSLAASTPNDFDPAGENVGVGFRVASLVPGPDSDGDGVPDSLDNCPYEPNPTQSDIGGLGAAPPDGIGDACQCGDTNNSGTVTATDATVLNRAILGLGPYFSVASGLGGGGPGLAKCNTAATVTPGVAGCTATDATVISRALLSLSPGIAQGCDAAQP